MKKRIGFGFEKPKSVHFWCTVLKTSRDWSSNRRSKLFLTVTDQNCHRV